MTRVSHILYDLGLFNFSDSYPFHESCPFLEASMIATQGVKQYLSLDSKLSTLRTQFDYPRQASGHLRSGNSEICCGINVLRPRDSRY
jgi:hypothetical protein